MKLRRPSRLDLPLNAIDGNIIAGGGRASAVHRVHTYSSSLAPLSEKQALHGSLSRWMMEVKANFSVYRVCREYPAEAYKRDALDLIDERHADRRQCEAMLETHASRIRQMRSFTPEVYFVTELQSRSMTPWNRGRREIDAVREDEKSVLGTLTDYLDARRATTLELQWMMRRAAVRGVREPDVDPFWEPPAITLDGGIWSAGRQDVLNFMPTVLENGRSVLVQGEDGESLQAFLAMGAPPKQSDFPGSAELLFRPLESLEFPVDAVVHVRWIHNKKMLSASDNAIKDANDEVDDASARFLNRKIKRRAQDVVAVQEYFESEPFPPGLETFICFAVSAPAGDHRLLRERITRIERAYKPIALYRPFGIQTDFFGEHLLRPDGADARDYRRDYKRVLIAEQLASMMPIATTAGGSKSGFYVGHTIPGAARPVRYNPLEASKINRAGAVELNGTLGGGKTVALQTLAYQADRRGSLVFDIDPKKPIPDHSLHRWKGMEGRVHRIVISNDTIDDHVGSLDPLVVALPEMAEELMTSYMIDILPRVKEEWQTEIIGAVRAVLRQPDPCSWKVVELLLASDEPDARAAGKAIQVWAEWGLCKFAFSRGGQRHFDVQKPVTMVAAPALTLPMAGTDRANYDQSERVSVATFKLIIARAMRTLASSDRTVHKLLVIDEAHVLTSTRDGRRFLEMVIRMGRYMNITVVMATQLAGDLAELNQLIGVRFVFRQETEQQAKINLAALGLDPENKEHVDLLTRGLADGRCIMQGLDKRVVLMQFDVADPDVLRTASTRPGERFWDEASLELDRLGAPLE